VKYRISGSGKPVIIFHGSFGGLKQAELLGHVLRHEGFQTISFSRPGYPGTDIEEGKSPKNQARLAKKILDENSLDSVDLVAYSAGGLPGIEFMKQYPESIDKAVLDSVVITSYDHPHDLGDWFFEHRIAYNSFTLKLSEQVLKASVKLFPKTVFRLVSHSQVTKSEQLDYFKRLMSTVPPITEKREGVKNDLKSLADLENPPEVNSIDVEVLLTDNREVPAVKESTDYLSSNLSNSTKKVFEQGGHTDWIDCNPEKRESVVKFLKN